MLVFDFAPDKSNADAFSSLSTILLSKGKIKSICIDKHILLLFECHEDILQNLKFASKLDDWLNGESVIEPDPLIIYMIGSGERIRLAYCYITNPAFERGLNINSTNTPGLLSIFALNDPAYTESWISSWNSKLLLSKEDIIMVRDNLGEKVAYYFAFLQFYCTALIIPAIVGLFTARYSISYGIFIIIWAIAFHALWKRQEEKFAILFQSGHASQSFSLPTREGFRFTSMKNDIISGEATPQYPLQYRIFCIFFMTIPCIIVFVICIVFIIVANLAAEIYVTEYYSGPLKHVVVLLPTITYALSVPTLNGIYSRVMVKLNNLENHQSIQEHRNALSQKTFLVLSIVAFLNLFVYGFIFVPLHDLIGRFIIKGTSTALIGPDLFTSRLVYFVVTGQIVNAIQEVAVPFILTFLKQRFGKDDVQVQSLDINEKKDQKLIATLKAQMKMESYDVFDDYVEMVCQFGYIVLFSAAWPYTSLACLVNNFFELRGDAIKIISSFRRPIAERAQDIGPWNFNIYLMIWMGSISTSALCVLYQDWDADRIASEQMWERLVYVLAAVFISERAFFVAHYTIESVVEGMKSVDDAPRREKYMLKKSRLSQCKHSSLAADCKNDSIEFGILMHDFHSLIKEE